MTDPSALERAARRWKSVLRGQTAPSRSGAHWHWKEAEEALLKAIAALDAEPVGEVEPTDAEMRADLEAAGIDVDETLERLDDTIRDGASHLAAVERRVADAHAAGRAEAMGEVRETFRAEVDRLKLQADRVPPAMANLARVASVAVRDLLAKLPTDRGVR